MIGKRKRESVVVRKTSQSVKRDELDGAYDVLRQHFEATFEPIPQPNPVSITDDVEEDASEEASQHSDWSGLSDDGEDTPSVQVVEHAQAEVSAANSSRATEFKAFMSSKLPREVQTTRDLKAETDSEDESETINLKHDLDLQRLLKESHLFENGEAIDATEGKQRHKANDLRMQSLGSKSSLFNQEKMPMSHRKGIHAKATMKDTHRRSDAAQNGIILEKAQRPASGKKTGTSRRERGVDAPGVGKFRSGTLNLSSRDIAGIQGSGRPTQRRARR